MPERATLRRSLQVIFAALLVLAISGLIAVAVFPVPLTTAHTEFYILGANGTATGYPSNLSVGETGTVVVGIENNEHERVTYQIVVASNKMTFVTRTVTLDRREQWRDEVSISFEEPGLKTVNLLLYKGGGEPYRELHITVNVTRD